MRKNVKIIAVALLVQVVLPRAICQLLAKAEKAPYPDMAPLSQYLMPGKDSEIALARGLLQNPSPTKLK
jgi:ACR3 family arsenite efflux pump ArsB